MTNEPLTRQVIGCAMRVHRTLGPGYLESVYQHALAWDLRLSGLPIECERRLEVRYRDALVGEFVADMIVGGCVLVENKAVRALAPAHAAQLVNYLTTTKIDVGLLINFGAASLQFRRVTRVYGGDGKVKGF